MAHERDKKIMSKRPSFAAYKKRALQNEEVRAAYDLLGQKFALLEKFIKARKKASTNKTKSKKV